MESHIEFLVQLELQRGLEQLNHLFMISREKHAYLIAQDAVFHEVTDRLEHHFFHLGHPRLDGDRNAIFFDDGQ